MSIQSAIDELREFVEERSPAFVAVVLDEISHARLLKWWKSEVGPLLSRKYAHHMTVQFAPSERDLRGMPMGEKVSLQVIAWAQTNSIQTVAVRSSMKSSSTIPHVTVATDGVPPSKSNALIAAEFTRVRGPKLSGTLMGQERTAK